jgi:DNA-binding NarL/FixJ family response regulator
MVRAVGSAASPDEFLQEALRGVVKLVPCLVATINEVVPSSNRVAVWVEPPSFSFPDGAPELLAELAGEHPLIHHFRETRDGSAHRISDFWSQNEFHASRLYRLLYQPMGIEYQMSVTLPAPRPTVLGLVVNRADDDFTQRDRAVLNAVRPYLTQAWRTARDQERLRALINAATDVMERSGSGAVMLTDPPEELTPGALVTLYRYFGRPSPTSALPARVERWLAAPAHRSQGLTDLTLDRPLSAQLAGSRVALRYVPGNGAHPGALLLSEERRVSQRQHFESLGLTTRQAEIVRLITVGASNAVIADRLHVSPATVKKHLDNIYGKLGVRGRGALTAFVLNIVEP